MEQECAKQRQQEGEAKIFRNRFERRARRCYNSRVPHGLSASAVLLRGIPPSESASTTSKRGTASVAVSRFANRAVRIGSGQVAQVVERSPEKAGVGGSTPSLATILFNGLANRPEISHL
jgi:hypothetical protein